MTKYFLNKREQSGHGCNHEVHREDCYLAANIKFRRYLGEFPSSAEALAYAKVTYPDADGCAHCCPEINHG
ncbi:MAG: hypothetical protein LKF31_03200 [Muribaculaceae bacterium]|jgi:hypothetical protein|nr:hypothetical protein [Muribaculaceae bacterium]